MSGINKHPGDGCYSVADLQRYIENEMSESESSVLEKHVAACEQCRKMFVKLGKQGLLAIITQKAHQVHLDEDTIIEYLDNTLSAEKKEQLEQHIKSCTICQHAIEVLKKNSAGQEEQIEFILEHVISSPESTLIHAEKILKALDPLEDAKLLEDNWHDFLENHFDWEQGLFHETEPDKHDKLFENAAAFGPTPERKPVIITCIRLLAEIRSWKIQSDITNISTHIDDLKKHLQDKGFKDTIISLFLSK